MDSSVSRVGLIRTFCQFLFKEYVKTVSRWADGIQIALVFFVYFLLKDLIFSTKKEHYYVNN